MLHLKTKLFFLPLEIKTRELYPKLYFAKKALEKNFSCFIGDKAGIFRATKYFNSGVYFYKSINFTDTDHIKKIKKNNNKYIVLDEEGGFTFNTVYEFKKFQSVRSSKENVSLIDKYFNWGNFDNNLYVKKYPKSKNKFCVSGGLRFEVCKKSIVNKVYKKQIDEIKKIYGKKYILITTSHLTSKKEVINYRQSDKYFMNLRTKKNKNERFKELNSMLKLNSEFKKLLLDLFKSFPEENFILRPHPSENLNDWKNFFKKNLNISKNISINTTHDLNALIYNSKCVINSKSASAMHAFFQKKPIISFIPNNVKYTKRLIDYIGSKAKNKKKVLHLIKDILNKKFFLSSSMDAKTRLALSDHVCNMNSKIKPTNVILKEVKKIYKSKSTINLIKVKLYSPFYLMSDFIFKILKIKYYNPKLYNAGIRSGLEKMGTKGINKSEIINFFKNHDMINKINILSFGKNCFLIYKI